MEKDIYRVLIKNAVFEYAEALDEYNSNGVHEASKFIKDLSTALEDIEVIGLATILESKARLLIDEKHRRYQEEEGEKQRYTDRCQEIRQLCIKVFYKDNCLSADMEKYVKTVEKNKEILIKTGRYIRICKYIDSSRVLDKTYNEIKNQLITSYAGNGNLVMPDINIIKSLFSKYLSKIYSLADRHVNLEIKKAQLEIKDMNHE